MDLDTLRAALKAFAAPYSDAHQALGDHILEVAERALRVTTAGPEHEVWERKLKKYVWRPIYHGTGGREGNWINDWSGFTRDLVETRQITSARRAAELYAIFISDHLPLVADIPI